jgi:hypothetical protein
MMGDSERRMVISDDLGNNWEDNRGSLDSYQNSVCGIALSEGYLTGTDAITRTGVQYVNRSINSTNERFNIVREFEKDNYPGSIIYVGGSFYKRGDIIVATFTPETSGRYTSGARGCIILSEDDGKTWRKIWTDNLSLWHGITNTKAIIAPNGKIYVKCAGWVQDLDDGLGLCGRMIKIDI